MGLGPAAAREKPVPSLEESLAQLNATLERDLSRPAPALWDMTLPPPSWSPVRPGLRPFPEMMPRTASVNPRPDGAVGGAAVRGRGRGRGGLSVPPCKAPVTSRRSDMGVGLTGSEKGSMSPTERDLCVSDSVMVVEDNFLTFASVSFLFQRDLAAMRMT